MNGSLNPINKILFAETPTSYNGHGQNYRGQNEVGQKNLPPGSLYYTILTKMHFFDKTLLTNHVYQVHQRVYSNFEQ